MTQLHLAQLDEWFNACTIEKCTDDTADALARLAQAYFSVALNKLGDPLANSDKRSSDSTTAQNSKNSVCFDPTSNLKLLPELHFTSTNELADAILPHLTDRQRIVLLLKTTEIRCPKSYKISLNHPSVLKVAGCGKSQLYAARKKLNNVLLKHMATYLHENDAI